MAQAAEPQVDLDEVRKIVSQFKYQDWEEAQELILSVLEAVNEHFGYVSLDAAEIIADHLGTTIQRVHELITFYADFRSEPRGKHFMTVCYGMSCFVGGAQGLVQDLQDVWGVADGGTTADGELTVQVANVCLGACSLSPLVQLDGEYHGNLTPEALNNLIQRATGARGEARDTEVSYVKPGTNIHGA